MHTSDKRWAGTDAAVTARLFGEADGVVAETAFFNLENSANNFERGRVDEFLIDAKDVGVVQGIEIKMDNSGLGAAWHLRAVSVAKASAPDDAAHFDHDDWLDGKTPSVVLRTSDPAKAATCRYVIETLTSDLRGAGTDAGVSIALFGEKGETGALPLENSADNFRRGKKTSSTSTRRTSRRRSRAPGARQQGLVLRGRRVVALRVAGDHQHRHQRGARSP